MKQEIIITAIGASIPLLIFYLGYLIKRRQDKIEGKHRNRIQFELEAKFFGPQKGHYIAEITMLLSNEGLVRKEIHELPLRIKGIKREKEIGQFEADNYPAEFIADFPEDLVKANVLKRKVKGNEKNKDEIKSDGKNNKEKKKKKDAWLVEPGIVQQFTYVVRIPEDIRFILVRSSFEYHENSTHSAQKVFELKLNEFKKIDK